MRKQIIAGALLAAALSGPAARAAIFDFSYELAGGDILAGQMEGILQADNNTIVVDAVLDFVTLNGVPAPSLPSVFSVDEEFVGLPGPLDPIVTLDGSFMDLLACTSPQCFDGFLFAVDNFAANNWFGGPVYNDGGSYGGGTFEPYSQSNWSMTAVPLPATLPLLLIGGGPVSPSAAAAPADRSPSRPTHGKEAVPWSRTLSIRLLPLGPSPSRRG